MRSSSCVCGRFDARERTLKDIEFGGLCNECTVLEKSAADKKRCASEMMLLVCIFWRWDRTLPYAAGPVQLQSRSWGEIAGGQASLECIAESRLDNDSCTNCPYMPAAEVSQAYRSCWTKQSGHWKVKIWPVSANTYVRPFTMISKKFPFLTPLEALKDILGAVIGANPIDV